MAACTSPEHLGAVRAFLAMALACDVARHRQEMQDAHRALRIEHSDRHSRHDLWRFFNCTEKGRNPQPPVHFNCRCEVPQPLTHSFNGAGEP